MPINWRTNWLRAERWFLVRQGDVWEEVERLISEKHIDLLIIGTHGRRGLGKLVFGSVAEQIFRHADCPVLTVGPGSFEGPIIDATEVVWPFLFATDFGVASLRALPYAVSFANRVATKLILLHVIPPPAMTLHRATAHDIQQAEELARQSSLRRLKELTEDTELTVNPEFKWLCLGRLARRSWKWPRALQQKPSSWVCIAAPNSEQHRTCCGPQPMRSCSGPVVLS